MGKYYVLIFHEGSLNRRESVYIQIKEKGNPNCSEDISSFDFERNKDFYYSNSPYVIVLIAHCLLDDAFQKILKKIITDSNIKKRINNNSLSFSEKVKLLNSFGLFDEGNGIKNKNLLINYIESFNKLRNRIAHGYHKYDNLKKILEEDIFWNKYLNIVENWESDIEKEVIEEYIEFSKEKRLLLVFITNIIRVILENYIKIYKCSQ